VDKSLQAMDSLAAMVKAGLASDDGDIQCIPDMATFTVDT
jgi:hypothetical protein